MAQIFNGLNDTLQRVALSRITWQLHGDVFKGVCPNDPLFRLLFGKIKQNQKYGGSDKFNYRCRDANKLINWVASEDGSRICFFMKIDEKQYNPVQLKLETPRQFAINRIKWQLKNDVMRGFSPDDNLFRGVFKSAYPDEELLYPCEGEIIHQWGKINQKMSWFRDEDLETGLERIVFTMPLYKEKVSQSKKLLTQKQLDRYFERFKAYLFRNNYHYKFNHLDTFVYFVFEKDCLSPEQVEQLLEYIEALY